ncbi:PREDICTED: UPF0481 [Prunus dulcis]|uniref:PREDICTED: UPF0481 n=1 Tax=Prunus dulcis TaxID=3755 RepID=A0A5E4EHZ3_PRUDU|nr:PREDICTED: UPF0481 [Prunus dulcis]
MEEAVSMMEHVSASNRCIADLQRMNEAILSVGLALVVSSSDIGVDRESRAQTAEGFTAELIEKTMDKLAVVTSESEDLSIYRVPNKLREVKADAYNPRVVSIGPFHRGHHDLAAMEKHKWLYTLHFIQYTKTALKARKCLKDCTNAIYDLDKHVRRCYAEEMKHVDVTRWLLYIGTFPQV